MDYRKKCYQCFRPLSSCMCSYTKKLDTNSFFVLLMHPKEFQKTKNTTGILTHLNLTNSVIYKGIDFSDHKKINTLIDDPNNQCYILYPDTNAINISNTQLPKGNKKKIFFLIDSTWACSKTILKKSVNLKNLPKISFTPKKISKFGFKTQPNSYCLSTIETTQTILELLSTQGIEDIQKKDLSYFIKPFEQMVAYQLQVAKTNQNIRYKSPYKNR